MSVGKRRGDTTHGGLVVSVEPGGLGESAGLRAGDRLLAIGGRPLRDLIDVRFYASEDQLDLVVERDGRLRSIRVSRRPGQELGVEFSHPTFDVDIRRCANDCDFCFVKMNAPGMRRSLFVKDDDYRYSFLFGHFVTLTNLTRSDWDRLEEQRLSPLYVSVHATDSGLRRRMLGRAGSPDILDQLRRLASLDIQVHAQVVLVPGVNDGAELERTLAELLALVRQPVESVSVVPVGLTRYHRGTCRAYTTAESASVVEQVEEWRARCLAETGARLVHLSDEWYLVTGRDPPLAAEYDGFPQVENGVGMVRQLLDEWEGLRPSISGEAKRSWQLVLGLATLACGTLIAPVLERLVGEWSSLAEVQLNLVPVVNDFFGAVTTVSGLLTGHDVVATLRTRDLGELVLLPRAMFTGRYGSGTAPPGVTLDDMGLDEISTLLGVRAEMAGSLTEAHAILSGEPSETAG